ncbi:MAG: phospholipase D family protein [Planctomycetes bacterium]|nr:phospholipase D family protein [Planctomycetota bacterium]
MTLYTNTTGKDSVRNAFFKHSQSVPELLIATPFFSYDEIIKETLKLNNECLVRMIVRLGPATSPEALQKIIDNNQVQIRYFTSPQFHSKLYIFGDKVLLVGSANLTSAGFQSNREICIEISPDDDRFDDLLKLYNSYWIQADVLTKERLIEYSKLYKNSSNSGDYKFENEIKNKFGDISPKEGVQVDKKRISKEKVFLESYRRTYQEFHSAYKSVENIYKKDKRRQQPEEIVPLRIEIDQFFSFVREKYAKGDIWKTAPILGASEQEEIIKEKLEAWFSQRWNYLDNTIPEHIKRINQALSSKSNIENSTMEQIFHALDVCHSIHDRLRFFLGGHETLKKVFTSENDLSQIQKVISYLLHGKDDFITRMGTCIFDDAYSIKQIGRSAVQELLGWVNKEDIPICNGRTVKALRYLGFKVVVFN